MSFLFGELILLLVDGSRSRLNQLGNTTYQWRGIGIGSVITLGGGGICCFHIKELNIKYIVIQANVTLPLS